MILTQTNKYRESNEQHKKITQQILFHRDSILSSIHAIYQNILHQMQNSIGRRQLWLKDFNLSVCQLKDELASLTNTLAGEKYLRTVIMWNRMKPNQTIEEITKKAQKNWLIPSFQGCNSQAIINFISNYTNLKVLQIQGDSGVKKILQIIRVLRYGQQQNQNNLSKTQSQRNILASNKNIKGNGYNIQANFSLVNQTINRNSKILQSYPQILMNSSNRKVHSKKIQVLSSFDQHKANSQLIQNK